MKTLFEIQRKLDQSKDLSKIITTMKNISIVNMTHYERRIKALRQYFSTVEQGFQIFLKNDSETILKRLKEKKETSSSALAAIVIGSEKGLCGEFNETMLQHYLEKTKEQNVFALFAIGYKISSKLSHSHFYPSDFPSSHAAILTLLKQIMEQLQNLLAQNQIGEVVFFHHQLVSSLQYAPVMKPIFPLNLDWLGNLKDKPWPSKCLPTYTMDQEELFYELSQEALFISMYRSFIESLASENAARLSSMQIAEENIEEQLTELQNTYNLQRQNQITEELSDIISGTQNIML